MWAFRSRVRQYARTSLWLLVFFGRFLYRLRPVAVAASVAAAGQRAFQDAIRESASPNTPNLVRGEHVATERNRRLRALLEELRTAVLPEHQAAVEDELARLDASVAAHFGPSRDLDRARTADRQGLGGASPVPRTPDAAGQEHPHELETAAPRR